MSRPQQPEPFLRGCAWPAGKGVSYPRCDPGPQGLRLPADTRASAALPVGVRFELETEAQLLELTYRTETDELGYRGRGAGTQFVCFRGRERVDAVDAKLGDAVARLRCGAGVEPVTLYLPEGMRPTLSSLRALDGALRPGPPRPRWLCYGDSIAEGWCASEPAGAWPHVVAREQALDVVNLGYAGAARGETASAEELAVLPAELISIAHGTNCWTRTPHSAEHFAAGLRDFLDIVRSRHPETPIVAISPILRADAEDTPNALGACLADLRVAFEAVVVERQTAGDAALALVPGLPLLGKEALPDGIHPDDDGHAELARVLGPVLGSAVRGERRDA